jgi:hypothetical protein
LSDKNEAVLIIKGIKVLTTLCSRVRLTKKATFVLWHAKCSPVFAEEQPSKLPKQSVKIEKIINQLKSQGEEINDEVLAHISLLPYKHVLPQGTYFVENK